MPGPLIFSMFCFAGCASLRAPYPVPPALSVSLSEPSGGTAEDLTRFRRDALVFEREATTCEGIAQSLTSFAGRVQQLQSDAAFPSAALSAGTVFVGAATGAISAYLAATARSTNTNAEPTAVVSLVGGVITAALGIPAAAISGRAGSQNGQADAARTASVFIHDLVLQQYSAANQEIASVQPTPDQARLSLSVRSAMLRQQCEAQLNTGSIPAFEQGSALVSGSERNTDGVSARSVFRTFTQQIQGLQRARP